MARKTRLDPGKLDQPSDMEASSEPAGAIGGFWGGSALNLLRQRIDEVHGSIVQGILNGTIVLPLAIEQIDDEIGSDRVGNWKDDEDFNSLLANIKRRGQVQPIRVRPKDLTWAPDPEDPLKTVGTFLVQSGRRRIEACRRLNKPVLAILSTEKGDAALADLEERFHENTSRQDLNGFEELLSIGHLAERLQDLSQSEIAERLHVSQNDVSLGLSCVELREELLKCVDVSNTPKRAYRTIVPKLRAAKKLSFCPKPTDAVGKMGRFESNTVSVEVKRSGKGLSFKVSGDNLEGSDLDKIAEKIASLFIN